MLDETPLRDAQREYAEKLLTQYDPAVLVARLLVLAEPPLPREPMQIAARGPERGPPRAGDERFVIFTLAWGHRRGATPARVLAQLCRRGDISSQHVGALDIGPHDTRVEIARGVADAFAARVQAEEPGEPVERQAEISRGGAPIERRGRPRRERNRSERGGPRPRDRGDAGRERGRGAKPRARKRKGRFPRS